MSTPNTEPSLDLCREQAGTLLNSLTFTRWLAESVLPEGDPDRDLIARLDDAVTRVAEAYDGSRVA